MARDPWTDVGDSAAYLAPRGMGQPDAWTEELTQAGRSGSQRLVEVVELVPPAEVSDALGLSSTDRVVVRRRAMLVDDQLVELTDSYYPARLAAGTGLAEMRKIPGGAPTLLAKLGCRPKDALEELTVRPATEQEAEALGLAPGSLVIVLFRIVVGEDRIPFEVSVMTMRPDGRRFRYRVKVG
jgi:GntR family transcriptional regulator